MCLIGATYVTQLSGENDLATKAPQHKKVCCHGLVQVYISTLRWRHYGRDGVSNHQPHDCLLNRLFRRRSKKTSKLRVTGHLMTSSDIGRKLPCHESTSAWRGLLPWACTGLHFQSIWSAWALQVVGLLLVVLVVFRAIDKPTFFYLNVCLLLPWKNTFYMSWSVCWI